MVVGLAINRCGGDLDFQAVAVIACQCILRRTRLQVDCQDQVVALPVIPGRCHRVSGKQRQEKHSQYLQADNRKQGSKVDSSYGRNKMPDRPQQRAGKTVQQ
jgi:hypothetical protein